MYLNPVSLFETRFAMFSFHGTFVDIFIYNVVELEELGTLDV